MAKTTVGLSATLTIAGQQIVVQTEDVAHASMPPLVFSLTKPVRLGHFSNFEDWYKQHIDSGDSGIAMPEVPKDLPELKKAVEGLKDAEITLTSLVVDKPQNHYEIGITMDMSAEPIEIGFDAFQLDGIGVVIKHKPDAAASGNE